jgi:hypothetical protein
MHSALTSEAAPDFSMVLGGPLYQLLLRLRVVREPLDLLTRRILTVSMIAWLPLLALAIIAGRAWSGVKIPFLYDIDVHVRFLVSLPLLILAEWVVHIRFRPIISQFINRNIITAEDRTRFERIIQSSLRLRNSVIAEVLLILFVIAVGPISFRNLAAVHTSTWYADIDQTGVRLTLPGMFYLYAALPIFQFILLRWYFRLFIWYRFLFKVSRLNLHLMPAHPDGAGGLGFLTGTAHALAPLLVAQSALLAGLIANRIFYDGAKLISFKMEILAVVLFLLVQALAPLFVFVTTLASCQRLGSRTYGVLASQYTQQFHDKWIVDKSTTEPLLGSADIQSLADLANSFSVIRSMSVVPFTKTTVLRLAIVSLLPIAPLMLTVIPLEQMVDHLLKALI